MAAPPHQPSGQAVAPFWEGGSVIIPIPHEPNFAVTRRGRKAAGNQSHVPDPKPTGLPNGGATPSVPLVASSSCRRLRKRRYENSALSSLVCLKQNLSYNGVPPAPAPGRTQGAPQTQHWGPYQRGITASAPQRSCALCFSWSPHPQNWPPPQPCSFAGS